MHGEIGSVAASALTAGMALGIVSRGAGVAAWLVALLIVGLFLRVFLRATR